MTEDKRYLYLYNPDGTINEEVADLARRTEQWKADAERGPLDATRELLPPGTMIVKSPPPPPKSDAVTYKREQFYQRHKKSIDQSTAVGVAAFIIAGRIASNTGNFLWAVEESVVWGILAFLMWLWWGSFFRALFSGNQEEIEKEVLPVVTGVALGQVINNHVMGGNQYQAPPQNNPMGMGGSTSYGSTVFDPSRTNNQPPQ